MQQRRFRLALAAAATLVAGGLSAGIVPAQPVQALSSGSGINESKGFDSCVLPSVAAMQQWWYYTPYWWYSVYIGGANYACRPAAVSASWLNQVHAQGWNFLFTWVGLQPPCTSYPYRFSSNTTTAYNQGYNEAYNAWDTLTNHLGVTNSALNSPVVFDVDAAPSSCQSATNAFIRGWDDYLDLYPNQKSGVYGSVCGSSLASYAGISNPPNFIWGAYYNGNPSTSNLYTGSCGVPSGDWTNHQRFKQYKNTHYETWGGVKLSIDTDCANGPTGPDGGPTDSACV